MRRNNTWKIKVNTYWTIRRDQESVNLLVTIKFGKFEIYHQRFIFVMA
jgi:hypothetical protein